MVATGLVVVVLSAAAACSNDDTPSPATTTTTASVTRSPTPSSDPAAAGILDSYQAYWSARVLAQADPTRSLPKALTQYGSGAAVNDVRATVLLFRQQGIAMRGRPTLAPKVTDVSGTSATITDCVDSTQWKPIYVATGKSAIAPGQALRVVVTSTATNASGRWLITTAIVDRDRTC